MSHEGFLLERYSIIDTMSSNIVPSGQQMKIVLHINQLDELDEVLKISNEVFNPSLEELEKYHNKADWKQKISGGGLLISALADNRIVGFSICYPKDGNFHIWNVGVLNEYRKQGVWKLMHEEITKYAKRKGYNKLTLNTYKKKFPRMYAFALSNGYKEYRTEWEKSFFIKVLI